MCLLSAMATTAAAVCSVRCAARAAPRIGAARASASASSSNQFSARQPQAAACSRSRARAPRQPRLGQPARAAADEVDEEEVEVEAEEEIEVEVEAEDHDETLWETMQRVAAEVEAAEGQSGGRTILRVSQQHGLAPWEPNPSSEAAGAQQQAAAAPGGPSTTGVDDSFSYEELLRQLPGLQRQLRAAAQERVGLPPQNAEQLAAAAAPGGEESADLAQPMYDRVPRKPEPVLDEWDLRAKMEKRRRQQRDLEAWLEAKAEVGQYPSLAADWRTDIRCRETGNPTDPEYREWSQKEIWDLITSHGRNADPRDVQLFVRNPREIADVPAQGGQYNMEAEEYFESLGRLIQEDEVALIVDKDSEVALLAAEFSDFDDELLPSSDYDSDYGAAGGNGPDDDF